jgi:hypothetical protein
MAEDFHATAVAAAAAEAMKAGDIGKGTALYRSILEHHGRSPEASTAMNCLMTRRAGPSLDLEPDADFGTTPTSGARSMIWPLRHPKSPRTQRHFTNS